MATNPTNAIDLPPGAQIGPHTQSTDPAIIGMPMGPGGKPPPRSHIGPIEPISDFLPTQQNQQPRPGYDGPVFTGGTARPGFNDPAAWASGSPIGLMDTVGRFNDEGARDAQTREVDSNELVENRLGGLLSGNNKYIRDARLRGQEEAAARGMLTGSIGAGMSERAAIQSALPVASQDAATYGRVYDNNLGYQNQFGLAQQGIIGSLIGQEAGIRANLDESERGRSFQAVENQLQRAFQGDESALDRAFRMSESERDRFLTREQNDLMREFQANESGLNREFQSGENFAARNWQSQQAGIERDFSATQAEIARNWQGDQSELNRVQERVQGHWNRIYGQNGMLAQTLISIYENPNLTPQQQQAAVENANALFRNIFQNTAQTFAQGVPEIFLNPYPMDPNATPPEPVPYNPTPMPGNGGPNDPEANAGLKPNQLAQIARWTAESDRTGRPLTPSQQARIARWRAQAARGGGG